MTYEDLAILTKELKNVILDAKKQGYSKEEITNCIILKHINEVIMMGHFKELQEKGFTVLKEKDFIPDKDTKNAPKMVPIGKAQERNLILDLILGNKQCYNNEEIKSIISKYLENGYE
jgi:DNA-binding transcriptional regulator YhcF (GntR family)